MEQSYTNPRLIAKLTIVDSIVVIYFYEFVLKNYRPNPLLKI